MKRLACLGNLIAAVLMLLAGLAFADEGFNITYRHQGAVVNGPIYSGVLTVNIHNVSGQDVADVVAWVEGPNNVTFDGRRLFAGSLANGSQKEVVSQFNVPVQLIDSTASDGPVAWNVEFTSVSGVREIVSVVGDKVE